MTRKRITFGNRENNIALGPQASFKVIWEDRDKDLQSVFVRVDDAGTIIQITDGSQYKIEFSPQQLYDQGFADYIEHQPFVVRFDPVAFVFVVMIQFKDGIELPQAKVLLKPSIAINYSYEVIAFEHERTEDPNVISKPALSDKYMTPVKPVPPKSHVPLSGPLPYVPQDSPLVKKKATLR